MGRSMNEIEKAQQEITEAREKLASAEARLSALSKPAEREYRAGEWVPKVKSDYWYICDSGVIYDSTSSKHETDNYRIKTGNVFPTIAIAEAAKTHADWWREFDMSDEGRYSRAANFAFTLIMKGLPRERGTPRYQTKESARAAIERLGGEQKVIDMLTRGRVFRFKWGGK